MLCSLHNSIQETGMSIRPVELEADRFAASHMIGLKGHARGGAVDLHAFKVLGIDCMSRTTADLR